MKRIRHIAALVLPWLFSGPLWAVTAQELDAKQAHLNEQWKRVEEVGKAHAHFLYLRDQAILRDHKRQLTEWYADLATWINSWKDILDAMGGDRLSDERLADFTVESARVKLLQVPGFTERIRDIYAAQDKILAELRAVRRFPAQYIDLLPLESSDDFSPQLALLESQIDEAQKQLMALRDVFNTTSMERIERFGRRLQDVLTAKTKSLALRYPYLEAEVAKIELVLVAMREVDGQIQRLADREFAMYSALDNLRIYEALETKKALEAEAGAMERAWRGNTNLPAEVRDSALERLGLMQQKWSSRFDLTLATNSARDLFVTRYQRELWGLGALVKTCQELRRSQRVDCNLLRTVVGFTPQQLREVTDAQAAYMESIITSAKKGYLRIAKGG